MERGENGVGEEGVRPLPWEEKKRKVGAYVSWHKMRPMVTVVTRVYWWWWCWWWWWCVCVCLSVCLMATTMGRATYG